MMKVSSFWFWMAAIEWLIILAESSLLWLILWARGDIPSTLPKEENEYSIEVKKLSEELRES